MRTTLQFAPAASRLEDYLDVVDAALAPLARRLPVTVSRDDLASAGRVALVETLSDFDGPPTEARAYAFTRVRGAMLDELRRLDPLSRRSRARVTAVRRAAAVLSQELGRSARADEVADRTGLSPAVVRRTEQLALAAEAYSADTEAGADAFARYADENSVSPVEFAESSERATIMQQALARLPANQAYVLRRYYMDDLTLEAIAAELGVSKERVRQIRESGEKKLRSDGSVLALWQAAARERSA